MGYRGGAPLLGGHEVARRVDVDFVDVLALRARHRVDQAQGVDLVAEELDADGVVRAAEIDIHRVAPHTEGAALELHFGPVVQGVHQPVEQAGEAARLAPPDRDGLGVEVVGVADAVKAGDAGDHDHVAPAAEQGACGAQAQFLDLVVDAQVLLDVGVRRGDVGLRLIVVVVGDEVLHRVVREEGLEFTVELGREGLVVAEDQGRTLQALDHAGHGESLARTRDAEQRHVAHARLQGGAELGDGLRLVTGGLVFGFELKFHKTYKNNDSPLLLQCCRRPCAGVVEGGAEIGFSSNCTKNNFCPPAGEGRRG